MLRRVCRLTLRPVALCFLAAIVLSGCTSEASGPSAGRRLPPRAPRSASASNGAETPSRPKTLASNSTASPISAAPVRPAGPVMLGIDVLASENFAPIAGKRVGLFTHAAGVNRFGVSTVDVLRKAPNVKLVCLFAPEHGLYGDVRAEKAISDFVDKRTGLPVYSLYGKIKRPSKAQLRAIDALVIDLQDIGVRSYTYSSWMRYAIEACFEAGVEVVVLDRPNPLGGLKVDGPPLDGDLMSDVGAFRVPYVHGLTIGELAKLAAGTQGALAVDERVRARGKLTVVPMRGWHRNMRWPETGLTFVPTSPMVPDFPACVGYAMTGLGCQFSGFTHGVGAQYPFRGLFYNGKPIDLVQRELEALRIPGLSFRKISVTKGNGQPALGVYVEVSDWDDWHPTELSFHLMRLGCRLSGTNPYARTSRADERTFNVHTGSLDWWKALKRDGAKVNVEAFLAEWRRQAQVFQLYSRKFWLYD